MAISDRVHYEQFESSHLDGVVSCALILDWPSYTDPATALAAFSAPGAVTWVSTQDGEVIGLAHLLTDGVIQSHLSLVGVLPDHRRKGVARKLVTAAFQQAGSKWLDLCSEPGSENFYRSFRHEERAGFRVYPVSPSSVAR